MKRPSVSPIAEIPRPERVRTNPHYRRNVFSTFRTHINLPFALFSTSSQRNAIPESESQYGIQHQHAASIDLQSQSQAHSISPSQNDFSYATNSVETNIWSGDNDNESADPAAPKMGTRAYRERERRDKEKRDSRDKAHMTRIVADNVRVEVGLPLQGSGGVEVRRELIRSEEAAKPSSYH